MQMVAEIGRPKGGPECEVPIEKGVLLLGSIEFQIDKHLMSHGTRIDPETRFFMARVRDAAGDAATKMLDEARNRSETAPACPPDGGDAVARAREAVEAPLLPPENDPDETGNPHVRHSKPFGRKAATVGLGTAAAALILALLLTGWASSDPQRGPADGTERSAGERPANVVGAPEAAVAGHKKTGPGNGASISAITGPIRNEMRTSPGLGAKIEIDGRSDPAPYRELAEALAIGLQTGKPGEQPPYPDPRAGPEQTAPTGEQAAAMAEQRLALTAAVRSEVQRRLALARFDPQHFDGIFGPATRAALGDWQKAVGIPATGYLTASALASLRNRTADEYRTMQAANKARARQPSRAVLESPLPQVSPVRRDGCSRTPTGEIAYGRTVRCDFRGLRQSVARLFD